VFFGRGWSGPSSDEDGREVVRRLAYGMAREAMAFYVHLPLFGLSGDPRTHTPMQPQGQSTHYNVIGDLDALYVAILKCFVDSCQSSARLYTRTIATQRSMQMAPSTIGELMTTKLVSLTSFHTAYTHAYAGEANPKTSPSTYEKAQI